MSRAALVIAAILAANLVPNKTQLAYAIGTWSHIIKAIEDGKRDFTVQQIQSLCDLYAVDARYLFDQSEDIFLPTPPPLQVTLING